MRVKALKTGWFGKKRIRAGEVFDVPSGSKAAWFVPTDEAPGDPKARGRRAIASSTKTGDTLPGDPDEENAP